MSEGRLVIDIGMFDAADTQYYLDTGHRVIAVEAHSGYVRKAEQALQRYIQSGQLTILNVAIAPSNGAVTLNVDQSNAGGHSIISQVVDQASESPGLVVQGCRMSDILANAPERPKLIKVDIEGADHLCLEALTVENRPQYLSCEMHDGLERQMPHLQSCGFTRFKLVDQMSFLEISNGYPLIDRLALGLLRRVGYSDPRAIRRAGRWFVAGFSSGPAPWESNGRWRTAEEVIAQFAEFKRTETRNIWLDLHAC